MKLLDLGLTHLLDNPWKQVTKRINMKEYAEEIDHVAPEQAWGSDSTPAATSTASARRCSPC